MYAGIDVVHIFVGLGGNLCDGATVVGSRGIVGDGVVFGSNVLGLVVEYGCKGIDVAGSGFGHVLGY